GAINPRNPRLVFPHSNAGQHSLAPLCPNLVAVHKRSMSCLSAHRYDPRVKCTFEGRHEGLPDCAKAPRKVDVCVPRASARRSVFKVALLLCITFAVSVLALSHPTEGEASSEERWIVLVDVSASLDQMDRQVSRK